MQGPPVISPFSPGDPHAPPIKKQRAGGTPAKTDRLSAEATDAIAKRRAELQKLQQKRGQVPGGAPGETRTSTDLLLARARSQLQSAAAPTRPNAQPPIRSGGRGEGAVPPAAPQLEVIEGGLRRSTAIFPEVAKSKAPPERKPAPTQAASDTSGQPRGQPSAQPPPVARKLDPAFGGAARSKSAPPVRPPPPTPDRTSTTTPAGPPPKKAHNSAKPMVAKNTPEDTSKPPAKATPLTNFVPTSPVKTASAPPTSAASKSPAKTGDGNPIKRVAAQKEAANPHPVSPKSAPPIFGSQAAPTSPSKSTVPKSAPPLGSGSSHSVASAHKAPPSSAKDLSGAAATKGPVPVAVPSFYSPFADSSPESVKPIASMAGHTPFVGMGQNEDSVASNETKTPGLVTKHAGHTPYPTQTPESSGPTKALAGHTPFAILTEDSDTPPTSNASVELRMQKELANAEKLKTEAMKKVKDLEKELTDLQSNGLDLHAMLQVATAQGDAAAVSWVKKQVQMGRSNSTTKQVGFLSPMAALSPAGKPLPSSSPPRRRMSLPKPKNQQNALDLELLKQAVERVEFEYATDLATFTIRRPFGLAAEQDLWFASGQMNSKPYSQKATVANSATIEVVAQIKADGSLLVVHDEGTARHQNKGGGWDEFGNVLMSELPLGVVSFIDKDATERDYSLDEVFDGAISVREYYCSSVLSTAAGLLKVMQSGQAQRASETPAKAKVPTTDIAVDTKDLPEGDKSSSSAEQKHNQREPPEEASGDVLTVFAGMFFSGLVSLFWHMVIVLPLRILSFTFALAVSILIVSLAWAHMADEYSRAAWNGNVYLLYNRPGIM